MRTLTAHGGMRATSGLGTCESDKLSYNYKRNLNGSMKVLGLEAEV